jgi:hypothetical protein
MKLVKANGTIVRKRRRCTKRELIERLEELMIGDTSCQHHYSSVTSAASSLRTSIKRYDYPLKLHVYKGVLYSERTDM